MHPHFAAEDRLLRRRFDGIEISRSDLKTSSGLGVVTKAIHEQGFVVVRGLLDPSEVEQYCNAIRHDIQDWPVDIPTKQHPKQHPPKRSGAAAAREDSDGDGHALRTPDGPPPYVDFDPAVRAGLLVPETKALGVRRLFRIATNNTVFRTLCLEDERLVAPARHMLGSDLKLVQSMALLKPPGTGEKRWHQDQGVFRLSHVALGASCVLGWWIALDAADEDNGCMHFWPGSQKQGVVEHSLPVPASPAAHIHYSVSQCPPPEETVAVPLQPGDALFFDVACVHGTPANNSNRPRRALQMQYAPCSARPTKCPTPTTASNNPDAVAASRVTKANSNNSHVNQQPQQHESQQHESEEQAQQQQHSLYPTLSVVQEVGHVFDAHLAAPSDSRSPTAWFDCDADRRCTEPQFWSFRKAEALVAGQDHGPEYI
eukprot:m.22140 g.22140  ORF g.22140 m.22140 type:complete len:428 (+) comp6699_c0_seq1:42-1325(+)